MLNQPVLEVLGLAGVITIDGFAVKNIDIVTHNSKANGGNK